MQAQVPLWVALSRRAQQDKRHQGMLHLCNVQLKSSPGLVSQLFCNGTCPLRRTLHPNTSPTHSNHSRQRPATPPPPPSPPCIDHPPSPSPPGPFQVAPLTTRWRTGVILFALCLHLPSSPFLTSLTTSKACLPLTHMCPSLHPLHTVLCWVPSSAVFNSEKILLVCPAGVQ